MKVLVNSLSFPRHNLTVKMITFIISMLIASPMSFASNNATDMLTLLSFKTSISDPNGALESWNHSLHFCQWSGVTCGKKHKDRVTSLKLNSVGLSGQIPPLVTNLSFLQVLDLSQNNFTGQIPEDLGKFSRLLYLNLSHNYLGGMIPANLTQCYNLEHIDLSDNALTGEIPRNIHLLSKLLLLNFGRNNLTGTIPPSIANISPLSVFQISSNNVSGSIPESIGRLANLTFLDLSINTLAGSIPSSIYNRSSLKTISLWGNQLEGHLPPNIFNTMPNLEVLLLHHNNLSGQLPVSLSNASNLAELDLSSNSFKGTIPPGLGNMRSIVRLLLASNQLEARTDDEWEFMASLTNCSQLKVLVLAKNNFAGTLPNSVANLSRTLTKLYVSHNKLSGNIPTGIGNLKNLSTLDLSYNNFNSTIPASVGALRNLQWLILSGNSLTGPIPYSIGNLTQLSILQLDNNSFNRSIPESIGNCKNLQFLCVTNNKLSGSIPKEIFDIPSLVQNLDLSNNLFSGPLPNNVGKLTNLGQFSVANNQLTGEIPTSLAECQSLEYLYMQGNFFQGSIPQSLSNLKALQELDLSRNNLSGSIPNSLQKIIALQRLNLSFNNLEGEVPTDGIFKNLTADSIFGNNELCGGNQGLQLNPCKANSTRKQTPVAVKVLIPVLGAVVCLVMLTITIRFLLKFRKLKKPCLHQSPLEDQLERVTYGDILRATNDFSASTLIGVGSFGSVYKGIIDETMVAIKVLNLEKHGASKSFIAECEALRSIRHRNLVKIITACSTIDYRGNNFKALVLKYMPNGSLEEWLHESKQGTLTLAQRLVIAIDMASALDYLHHHAIVPIVHCDLKPSNVLLNEEMHAHIGDFGLAKFLHVSEADESGTRSTFIKGTIGYVPPEYGMGGQASVDGDIYSYGIMLLELITGKRPTDDMFKEGFTLHSYVQMTPLESILDIVDPSALLSQGCTEIDENIRSKIDDSSDLQKCIIKFFDIGLACSKDNPRERMQIEDVMRNLRAVQQMLL